MEKLKTQLYEQFIGLGPSKANTLSTNLAPRLWGKKRTPYAEIFDVILEVTDRDMLEAVALIRCLTEADGRTFRAVYRDQLTLEEISDEEARKLNFNWLRSPKSKKAKEAWQKVAHFIEPLIP